MGDRAPGSFTVYTCPDQCTANKIISLADGHGMSYDWGGSEIDSLRLGELICDDEMSLGDDDFIAGALQELGVIAKVTQDAKYEFDATVYYTHPELGRFDASGNQSGEVMVPASLIDKLVEKTPLHWMGIPLVLGSDVGKLTGRVWHDEIVKAEKALVAPGATLVWEFDDDHDCEKC